MDVYEDYRKRLAGLAEAEYKEFNQKLNPGIDNILGVRVPAVRALAKELAKGGWRDYFAKNEDIYFEETLLQGLTIGFLRGDTDMIVSEIKHFLPKINGWAMCDSFCAGLKIAKKEPALIWGLVRECAESERPFYIRFAVVMMLNHYIGSEHIDEILSRLGKIRHDEYYVKMAVAWAVSVCFVKQREKTLDFLNDCPLDDFTFNKALQKIRESFRVAAEDKELMRELKR